MRKRWFLVGMIFLLVPWLFGGCGIAQEQYDVVVADLGKAHQELQSVKAELGGIQTKLETVQSELKATKDELAAKKTELESSQSEITSLVAEKESLIAEKESLQTKYDKLTDENLAVKRELTDIKKVYPARYFSSMKELQDWLHTNDVSDRPASETAENLYGKALEIQEDALEDGYIISAYIDYFQETELFLIILEAVTEGNVFMWNPETDDLTDFSGLSGLLKVR